MERIAERLDDHLVGATSAAPPLSRFDDLLLRRGGWIVAGFVCVMFAMHLSANWDADPDSVSYLSIARHLAHGEFERFGTPHLLYTPTFPLLISPAFLLPGPTFLWISIIQGLLAALLVVGVWWWFKVYSRQGAVLLAMLTAANIGVWTVQRVVRPEIAYIAATVWAGGLFARAFARTEIPKAFWGWAIGGAIVGALAGAIRPLPFICIGVFFTAFTFAWSGKLSWGRAIGVTALAGILSAAVVLGWLAVDRAGGRRAASIPHAISQNDQWTYIDYVKSWGSPFQNIAEGLRRETGEVGRLMLPGLHGSHSREGDWLSINTFIYFPFFAFVAYGWWQAARRTRDVMVLMAPAYFLLFVMSKFDQGTRYLVPLVPVMWACAWFALTRLGPARTTVLLILAALHLAISTGDQALRRRSVALRNQGFPAMRELAHDVGNTPTYSYHFGSNDYRGLMLSYAADRAIPPLEGPVPAHVTQLIALQDKPAPPGFIPVAQRAGIVLFRRTPTQ